jgi:hypothetical protein
MSTFLWFLCGLGLGVASGYAIAVIQQQFRSDTQAAKREERRRLLGLETRAARRATAVGTPRISIANYKRHMPKS